MLLLHEALLTEAKASGLPVLLVCYDPETGSLLLLPVSRVTLLKSLVLYNYIFDQSFQVAYSSLF